MMKLRKGWKIVTTVMIIMCVATPANASIWDDVMSMIGNVHYRNGNAEHLQSDTEHAEQETVSQLMVRDRVRTLNTVENVKKLSSEMRYYNVNAVCVDVSDTEERFYLIEGEGFAERYDGVVDVRVQCSSDDVDFCLERVKDGKIGILERIEISNRMRDKVQYSGVKCSMFDFCLVGGIV